MAPPPVVHRNLRNLSDFMNSMRMFMIATLLSVATNTVQAQATADGLPFWCQGTPAIVRTSTLTGPTAQFQAAVAAHIKWYRDHGVTTNQ
ncbi:MAG: hypothetical protein CK531_00130 [Gemmatimonadetes bacterium]|nr:MAG: hypothetical protein CK531_00130 [Gemmatimonadota bacterium]